MIRSNKTNDYRSGFEALLRDLDIGLKNDNRPITVNKWIDLEGTKYEKEIYERIIRLSAGTCFEGTFKLVSGQKFPDIISQLNQKSWGFGIEAKTTQKDQWKSTGSSIVESTRIEGIDKIYLSFAKLGGTPEFMTKSYEKCLSGVAVTHSPRYTIDMQLATSETIFDKIGFSYEEIRNAERPFDHFRNYYTEGKDPSKILWWADSGEGGSESIPPILRVWSEVDKEERKYLRLEAFLKFPEVLQSNGNTKYNRTSLWLASSKAIIVPSLRDLFSAGGQKKDQFYGTNVLLPAVVYHLLYSFKLPSIKVAHILPVDFNIADWSYEIRSALSTYTPQLPKIMIKAFLDDARSKILQS
jgi:hypothetical protein